MKKEHVVTAFFIGLLLFMSFEVLLMLSPFTQPIFWAAVLSFAFYPAYCRLRDTLHNEAAAAAITTGLIFIAFVPLAVYLIFQLAVEAVKLYNWLWDSVQGGNFDQWILRVRSWDWVQRVEARFSHWHLLKQGAKNFMLDSAAFLGNSLAHNAGVFTKNALLAVVNAFLTLFVVFFFLRDGRKIYRFLYDITPMEEANKSVIFQQVSDTFSAVLRGQIFTALAQGVLLGLIFWALGLPLPIFFAAITMLAAMIPLLGAAAVWAPFVVYLAATQHYAKSAVLLVLGVFVISLIDNVLKPFLIGEKTKLPYLLLFLGILGGLQVYGLLGAFLAPAVLTLFFSLLKIYREKFLS